MLYCREQSSLNNKNEFQSFQLMELNFADGPEFTLTFSKRENYFQEILNCNVALLLCATQLSFTIFNDLNCKFLAFDRTSIIKLLIKILFTESQFKYIFGFRCAANL